MIASGVDFLCETVALARGLDLVLVGPVWPAAASRPGDADVSWACARVAFAIGHPSARTAADLDEVRAAVDRVRQVAEAKSARYYRIGSDWVLYEGVAVLGYPDGDRVLLFPVPPRGRYDFDPSVPQVTLDGRAVPWPPFEPPLLSLLTSQDTVSWDRAGFVPESRAVAGNARLPVDVRCEVRS